MHIDDINAFDSFKKTAVYHAARNGKKKHLELLLKVDGINLSKGEFLRYGSTPLHGKYLRI
jgi:hypothetical protein